MKDIKMMLQMTKLVRPLTGWMILAVVAGVIGNLAGAFLAVTAGYGMLSILHMVPAISLSHLAGILLILALMRGVLRYLEQQCNHYIAFRILALVRDKVFHALQRLCPAKLEGKDKGDLINMITSDTELLEVFYAHTISPICIAFFFTVIVCILLGCLNGYAALIALVSYIVIGVVLPLLSAHRANATGRTIRSLSGELSGCILESLTGLQETLQYGNQEDRLHKIEKLTDALTHVQAVQNDADVTGRSVSGTIILAADLIMLVTMVNVTTFPIAILVVLLFLSTFGPVSALSALGVTLQNTLAAGNRIMSLLAEKPVTEDVTGHVKTVFENSADLEHVTFGYDKQNVLEDVSLTIPKGQIVGISGRSGSGKSTMLRLLMHVWETDGVSVSGKDIRNINTTDLRTMEGVMLQEPFFFHDTIRNNLLLADPKSSEDAIIDACRKAAVHDSIMKLPAGYDTVLGEMGDGLSGGEKQRLSLARMFLHRGDLLLLDEPTSNLDSLNEAEILRSLLKIRKDKTIVLVSHRPSTLHIADRVYHMSERRCS